MVFFSPETFPYVVIFIALEGRFSYTRLGVLDNFTSHMETFPLMVSNLSINYWLFGVFTVFIACLRIPLLVDCFPMI